MTILEQDRTESQPRLKRPRSLDDLAEAKRWVTWRVETRVNADGTEVKTKVPYDPQRGSKAEIPSNPSTWGTRERAERRWSKMDNGSCPGGVGIVLGDLGTGYHLLGIDLDQCLRQESDGGVDVDLLPNEIIKRFQTYTEISPSGTGAKLFFLITDADIEAVHQLLGFDGEGKAKTRKQFAVSKHHEIALDRARYYAVTGKWLEGFDRLRVCTVDDVRWLIEEAGPEFKRQHSATDERVAPSTAATRAAPAMATASLPPARRGG